MQGKLVRYGSTCEHIAFISGDHPRHALLIAGLTEGLLGLTYAAPLAAALDGLGWSLVQVQVGSSPMSPITMHACVHHVAMPPICHAWPMRSGLVCSSLLCQPRSPAVSLCTRGMSNMYSNAIPPPLQLSSSYGGYGVSNLDTDAAELRLLALHLRQHHGSSSLVLIGHSTGCQITVRYMQKRATDPASEDLPPVLGTVLQAAVSDREFLSRAEHRGEMERLAAAAETMVAAGKGPEICCR